MWLFDHFVPYWYLRTWLCELGAFCCPHCRRIHR